MPKITALIILLAIACVGHGAESPTDSSPQANGSIQDMLAYATSFSDKGDFLRARIVYDLMLRAFRDSDNQKNTEMTCSSLVENIPAEEIGKPDLSFWSCPRPQLDSWYGDLDKYAHEPMQLYRGAAPSYPTDMIGESGRVEVQFDVDEDGVVRNVRVLESSDDRFSQSVLNMLKTYRYRPERYYGKPVAVTDVIQVYRFETEE